MKSLTTSIEKADDVSDKLVGKKLNHGLNHIDTSDNGLELHVVAVEGELIDYVIRTHNGCPVDEVTSITQTTMSKTTCWKCGKDASGNTHCWQVPCPVIVGPWLPELVVQPGYRMAVAPMG